MVASAATEPVPKAQSKLLLSLAVLLVAPANALLLKRLSNAVPQHMFAVSTLATFLLTPAFFLLSFFDAPPGGEQALPSKGKFAPMTNLRLKFFKMAIFDTLQMCLILFSSSRTPGQLQSLLGKAAIPVSMGVRFLWLGVRPSLNQAVGCALILGGAVCATVLEGGLGTNSADGKQSQHVYYYYALCLMATIPASIGAVYKGIVLQDASVGDNHLNAWCCLFQCMLSVLLLPLNSLSVLGDDSIPLQDIFPRLAQGTWCVLGLSTEPACSNCGVLLVFWLVSLLLFNVLLTRLMKVAGATLMFAVLTLKTPFTTLAFSSSWVMGAQAEAVSVPNLCGLAFILAGVVVYNPPQCVLGNQKLSETATENRQSILGPKPKAQ